MKLPTTLLLTAACLFSSCAFHSTATDWHGRVGPNGRPVLVKTTTAVGVNGLVIVKLIGGTDLPGVIEEVTGEIAAECGDNVRIIESSTENYWYGFPPFTWFLTPVITTVAAEYEPAWVHGCDADCCLPDHRDEASQTTDS